MKIKTSQESGKGSFERPHIEENLYDATLTEVKEISEGQYGPRVAFVYEIPIGDKKVELAHVSNVPAVATPNNKFGRVLIAHGLNLEEGETDTDKIIGTSARVMVEDYTYKEGDEEKIASSISKVKPLVETTKPNQA